MSDWLVWLIVAGAFTVAETASLTFVLIMFGGGAAAAALTAALGGPIAVQIVVAIVGTLVLLLGVRPIAQAHLTPRGSTLTGSDALVGQQAIVLSEVDAHDGRVRLNGGEWSARAFDSAQVLPAGTVVRVMEIKGATAVVLHETPYLESGDQT